jgi:hypothetical protein
LKQLHIIKINNTSHELPAAWHEVSHTQAVAGIAAIAAADAAGLLQAWLPAMSKYTANMDGDIIQDLQSCILWALNEPMLHNPIAEKYGLDKGCFDSVNAQQFALIEATLTEISTGKDTVADLIGLLGGGESKLSTFELSVLVKYCADNVTQLRTDYALAFKDSGDGTQGVDFGWQGVFFAIAETGVFGNLEGVHNTPIHEILNYLCYGADRAGRQRQLNEQQQR